MGVGDGRSGAERGDQITRPDRTMRGFGRPDGRTDFGERTSRLIFMSSSHDLSTPSIPPRVVSESACAIRTPTLTLPFLRERFFRWFGAWRIWGIRGREKSEVIPASPLDSFGENDFFPAKYLVTHGPESARLPPSPSPFSITWSRGRSHAFLSDKAKKKLVMARRSSFVRSHCFGGLFSVVHLVKLSSGRSISSVASSLPLPILALTGSPIFERVRFNEGAVYSPLLNLPAAESKMISLRRAQQRPGEIYIPVESGWALS